MSSFDPNFNFNLQTSHPLIKSEQNYVLDRKVISIHSVDRDYIKWPNSNNFGIELGESFHNVQSIRLINFCIPLNNYIFSEAYQNTLMSFSYTDLSGVTYPSPDVEPFLQIQIPEGSYSPSNLANTLQSLLNKVIYNLTYSVSYLPSGPFASTTKGISPFIVKYNEANNKLLFGVTEGSFKLRCNVQEVYTPTCGVNKAIFNQYTKWGLPSYLGFEKQLYNCSSTDISGTLNPYLKEIGGLYLDYEDPTAWLKPTGFVDASFNLGKNSIVCSIEAPCNLDVFGEDAIYMEMDRFNTIDEIYPYSERTGHLYNNDLGHRVNGSFAKIPITSTPFVKETGSRNTFPLNVFHSEPPVQKIERLRFKFRYHDGRLVDFKCLPFSFTLELNMLRDEQERRKSVRVPHLYNL